MDKDLNRWCASGGHGAWNEWHIWGPTRRIVLSHAIERLEYDGFMVLEDTKKHLVWRIEWKDGKATIL